MRPDVAASNRMAVDPVRVAKTLRARRQELGMTQQQIADRTGSLKRIVCRIESGRHTTQLCTLERICTVLEMDLYTLFVVKEAAND